ncbi:hypothetical protein AVEN_143388-1 [Araneus ventricosus]|uniref:Uncharacterized protein n=1 Tax=Araneus ventricosus TaxID=182803 RepID=A0A4Y2AE24_ARAVE|nr:hypothetical protein AVEN_143388-1 [Araneus ventricosus]
MTCLGWGKKKLPWLSLLVLIDQHLPQESTPVEAPTETLEHYHQSPLSKSTENLQNICSEISLDNTTSTISNNSSLPIAEIVLDSFPVKTFSVQEEEMTDIEGAIAG